MRKIIFIFGFIAFGLAVGFLTLWQFNHGSDSQLFLNIPSYFLGDGIYHLSIEYFGNPNSSQAHYTIPWILRVPQVYVLSSIMFSPYD